MLTTEQTQELHGKFQALIIRHEKELGVHWAIYYNASNDAWDFHNFVRDKNRQTKGNGAKALHEVCELADHYREAITLGCFRPKLFPYYESFGFNRVTHWRGAGYPLYFRRETRH